MKIVLSEKKLHNLIVNAINETISTSYSGILGYELNKRRGSNEKSMNTDNNFTAKLKELGFQHVMTQEEYDGDFDMNHTHERIRKEDFTPDVQRKLKQLLNFYNYRINKKLEGGDSILFYFETNYGDIYDGNQTIFYHACPSNVVNKILKQGLVPKDKMKNGDVRGERIYLSTKYDKYLFGMLGNNDYTVLTVDISKSNYPIKLYYDGQASNAVYTFDCISPQCISIGRQFHKEEEQEMNDFYNTLLANVQQYFSNFNYNDSKNLVGIIERDDKPLNTYVKFNIRYKPYFRYTYHPIEMNYNTAKIVGNDTTKLKNVRIGNYKGFDNVEQISKFIIKYLTKISK
jgi:hypothetical protein